jgi:hypothetical protein
MSREALRGWRRKYLDYTCLTHIQRYGHWPFVTEVVPFRPFSEQPRFHVLTTRLQSHLPERWSGV